MRLVHMMFSTIIGFGIGLWSDSFWIGLFTYVFLVSFFSAPAPTHRSERQAILTLLLMAIGISWLFGAKMSDNIEKLAHQPLEKIKI